MEEVGEKDEETKNVRDGEKERNGMRRIRRLHEEE